MAKLVVIGDIHFRGDNPRSRTDDYPLAIMAKLREVYEIARAERASGIIQTGDLFDSPGITWSVGGRLVRALREAPCPVYCVAGNHDVFGGNLSTLERTPLGFLAAMGYVTLLGSDPVTVGDSRLTGRSFDYDMDRDPSCYSCLPPPEGCVAIHVAHGMLLERAPGFDMRHTLIDQVETSAGVVITGHEHIGYGIKRRGQTLFVNPGALARMSAHPAEMERQVQVAVLEVTATSVDARLVPLSSAQPGHEVLSREHLERAAAREERLSEFLRLLEHQGEQRFLNLREIIDRLAAEDGLPRPVVDEALRRLGAAREIMGQAPKGGDKVAVTTHFG